MWIQLLQSHSLTIFIPNKCCSILLWICHQLEQPMNQVNEWPINSLFFQNFEIYWYNSSEQLNCWTIDKRNIHELQWVTEWMNVWMIDNEMNDWMKWRLPFWKLKFPRCNTAAMRSNMICCSSSLMFSTANEFYMTPVNTQTKHMFPPWHLQNF